MNQLFIARQSIEIHAPAAKVWDALVNPEIIKQYFFETNVVTDWKTGSPIYFRGEWQGNPYEDKGVILQVEPEKTLKYTHFSPLSGQADIPDNYHTVTFYLVNAETGTILSLTQDNNANEAERRESEKNWGMMILNLKKLLEK